jgi:hypothetical protein
VNAFGWGRKAVSVDMRRPSAVAISSASSSSSSDSVTTSTLPANGFGAASCTCSFELAKCLSSSLPLASYSS